MVNLSDYLELKKNEKFEWGKNDCVMFAAKWCEIATGKNFYSSYPEYNSEEQAYAIIKNNGSLREMVSGALGVANENYRNARRGDIVLLHFNGHETLGVIDDTGERISCVSKDRLARLPIRCLSCYWSIEKCRQ